MGSDDSTVNNDVARIVSIHAPTWGATLVFYVISKRPIVSIHAPTWGATRPNKNYNGTRIVSIHAPTWGAT